MLAAMSELATAALAGPPAILGGEPAFPEGLPLVRPAIPDAELVAGDLRRILESGVLTNGPFVRDLESRVAEYLGVRNAVAVASCTLGLMVVLRARGLTGDVVLPSFTFAATAHAAVWAGLRPTFADVDPQTLTLSPASARERAGEGAVAILATHTYGTPCDVEGLEALAEDRGLFLVFDAAHALGSRVGDRPVGRFGDAEVFSLTPTKLVVAGEGGIIATDDDDLAETCRIAREYGNPGDYDSRVVGLNARMPEINAALATRSLERLDQAVAHRNDLAARYRARLSEASGLRFPDVRRGDRSTYKDFTILVDPSAFGLDARCLGQALAAEMIETRRYYAPPVHAHQAYRHLDTPDLPTTEHAAHRVLTLPLWSEMTSDQVARVVQAIRRIQAHPESAGACEGMGRC
jgi:dTDP-4-amino-4,6-dideoxygalactose transaminase